MKTIYLVLSAALLALLLAGCGGNSGTSLASPTTGRGSLAFSFVWPTVNSSAKGQRTIPVSATQLVINVVQNSATIASATIARPNSSCDITNLPVGAVTVNVRAEDVSNNIVASGSTNVMLLANQTTNATVTLTLTGAGSVIYGNKNNQTDGAAMVWVPGGTFTMGCTIAQDGGLASGGQTQQVTLSGYWIYENEVTVAQYRMFCAATGHGLPQYSSEGLTPWSQNVDWTGTAGSLQQTPIVNVNWHDAQAYCAWAGVQLSSEAQYEYAARGPQGNNYPWGGTATATDPNNGWDPNKCVNRYNSANVGKSTWQIGSFPAGASWCGAQDLAGNVWEWCNDWYGSYSSTPVINPSGPALGTSRVFRGGSWANDGGGDFGRCARRTGYGPGYALHDIGFRCVSVSPGP